MLQSDRGLTYTGEIPKGSKIVEGKWWGADYDGPPLVSIEKKIADGLKLKIGDEIVVNVLGRDIPATIGNMRTVDWQSLGINFVLVFSPNAFKGAPHTHIATLTETHPDPGGDARIIKSVADAFPMVTSVRVREALETIGAVVTNLVLAIRGASAVTLISAILVLGGALAAGHRHRVYDAVILKTLGATRARLLGAYALEYLMIGFATADFRRDRGLRRGLADRDPADDAELHLAGRQRRRRGGGGADRHGGTGACRHAAGPEPEAGHGAAKFVTQIETIGAAA